MFFSCKKGEFDRFFNRLDRPVEESRRDRQPDRFPSLVQAAGWLKQTKNSPRLYALNFTHSVDLALLSFKIYQTIIVYIRNISSTGLVDKPGFVDRFICFN